MPSCNVCMIDHCSLLSKLLREILIARMAAMPSSSKLEVANIGTWISVLLSFICVEEWNIVWYWISKFFIQSKILLTFYYTKFWYPVLLVPWVAIVVVQNFLFLNSYATSSTKHHEGIRFRCTPEPNKSWHLFIPSCNLISVVLPKFNQTQHLIRRFCLIFYAMHQFYFWNALAF